MGHITVQKYTRELIANQQLKTAFATNGIIPTIIHWKISIILLINSQKHFTVWLNAINCPTLQTLLNF